MKRRNDELSPIPQHVSANAQNSAYYASAAAIARQMSPGMNAQFYMDTTMPPPDLINHFSQGAEGLANYSNQICYSTGQPVLAQQTMNWSQPQNMMYNMSAPPPTMPPLPTTLPPTLPPLPPLPPPSPTQKNNINNKAPDQQYQGQNKRGKFPDRSKLSVNHLTDKSKPFTLDTSATLPKLTPSKKKKKSKAPSTLVGEEKSTISVNKKGRRKPMSIRYTRKKEWDRDDAMLAIGLEKEFNNRQRMPMLIIRFPDPEINKEIVKRFSSSIQNVHFQQPSTPRYCFIQLRPDANVEQVKKDIAAIPFGAGQLIVESKYGKSEVNRYDVRPEEIDPYTLYIGNLPTTVTVTTVKEKFPLAQRIDIGYAQRMKYTRYAFIRYQNIEEAMDAFRSAFHLVIESRNLIVRFRRQKGNVGLSGESTAQATKRDAQPEATPQDEAKAKDVTVNEDKADTNELLDTSFNSVSTDTSLPCTTDKVVEDTVTVSQTVSNGSDDKKQEDDIVDSKEGVLKEAAAILERRISNAPSTSSFCTVKTESTSFNDITVKMEPKDEDDDDDFDYAMDEDIDDDDLEESDDDEYGNEKEEDDEDAHRYKSYHWDRLKLQEDNKPDIQVLEASLCYKKQNNKDDDLDSIFSETQNDDADLDF